MGQFKQMKGGKRNQMRRKYGHPVYMKKQPQVETEFGSEMIEGSGSTTRSKNMIKVSHQHPIHLQAKRNKLVKQLGQQEQDLLNGQTKLSQQVKNMTNRMNKAKLIRKKKKRIIQLFDERIEQVNQKYKDQDSDVEKARKALQELTDKQNALT